MSNKLTKSQQFSCRIKKASSLLGFIRFISLLVIFALYSALVRPHPILISSVKERQGLTGASPAQGHKDHRITAASFV